MMLSLRCLFLLLLVAVWYSPFACSVSISPSQSVSPSETAVPSVTKSRSVSKRPSTTPSAVCNQFCLNGGRCVVREKRVREDGATIIVREPSCNCDGTGRYGERCKCLRGTKCLNGTGNPLEVQAGKYVVYDKFGNATSVEVCLLGAAACPGGNSTCGVGYSNYEAGCNICTPLQYTMDANGVCQKCPPIEPIAVILLIVIFLIAVILIFMFVVNFGGYMGQFASTAYTFLQVTSLVISVDPPAVPPVFKDFMQAFVLVNLELSVFGPMDCFFEGTVEQLMLYQYGFMAAFPGLMMLILRAHQRFKVWRATKKHPEAGTALKALILKAGQERVRAETIFLLFSFFPMCRIVVDAFSCTNDNPSLLIAALPLQMECAGGGYTALVILGLVCAIVYGIGVPLHFLHVYYDRPQLATLRLSLPVERYFLKLVSKRKHIYSLQERGEYEYAMFDWLARYGSLSLGYRYHVYYFELFILLEKLILLNSIAITRLSENRIMMVLFTLSLALYLQMRYKPYLEPVIQALETTSLSIIFLLALIMLTVFMPNGTSDSTKHDVGVVCIVLVLCMLLALLVFAVQASRSKKNRLPRSRSMTTLYPEYSFWTPTSRTLRHVSELWFLNLQNNPKRLYARAGLKFKKRRRNRAYVVPEADKLQIEKVQDELLQEVVDLANESMPYVNDVPCYGDKVKETNKVMADVCTDFTTGHIGEHTGLLENDPLLRTFPGGTFGSLVLYACEHTTDLIKVVYAMKSRKNIEEAQRTFAGYLRTHANPLKALHVTNGEWCCFVMQIAAAKAIATPPTLNSSLSLAFVAWAFWSYMLYNLASMNLEAGPMVGAMAGGLVLAALTFHLSKQGYKSVVTEMQTELNASLGALVSVWVERVKQSEGHAPPLRCLLRVSATDGVAQQKWKNVVAVNNAGAVLTSGSMGERKKDKKGNTVLHREIDPGSFLFNTYNGGEFQFVIAMVLQHQDSKGEAAAAVFGEERTCVEQFGYMGKQWFPNNICPLLATFDTSLPRYEGRCGFKCHSCEQRTGFYVPVRQQLSHGHAFVACGMCGTIHALFMTPDEYKQAAAQHNRITKLMQRGKARLKALGEKEPPVTVAQAAVDTFDEVVPKRKQRTKKKKPKAHHRKRQEAPSSSSSSSPGDSD